MIQKLGSFLQFRNGKSSPKRTDLASLNVFGSNGIIGKCDEYNTEGFAHIIGRVGSYCGSVFLSEQKCWVTDNAIISEPFDLRDFDYFYYKLINLRLNRLSTGSGQPLINQTILKGIDVMVPDDIEVRQKIGKILRTLDKKIELNQKMNATLEVMAQALFKSWFVDFDPVKAKLAAIRCGRDPEKAAMAAIACKLVVPPGKPKPYNLEEKLPSAEAIDAAIASLDALSEEQMRSLKEKAAHFPSDFIESELGLIPEGWKIAYLPNVIDFLEGPGIRKWQYTEDKDGIKFINIRCIQNGDLKLDTASKLTREEALGKYAHFQLEVDDIVISTSGTLGRFAFLRKSHLPLSLNTSVIRFKKIEGVSTLHYIAGFVATKLQWELQMRATGSAQLNFGPMHLKQIKMLAPNIKLLEKHNATAENLFRKRQANLDYIDTLVNLRDALLPKLLSGEISVASD